MNKKYITTQCIGLLALAIIVMVSFLVDGRTMFKKDQGMDVMPYAPSYDPYEDGSPDWIRSTAE